MQIKSSGRSKSWAGFAVEIAVVVIGVGIALAAQQLVERINDRERADRAIAALRGEVGDIDFTASEIQIVAPCIGAQLVAIRDKLVAGDRTPLTRYKQATSGGEFVVRTPSRVWSDNTWQSIGNSDVLRRIEPKLDRNLGAMFAQVSSQREQNEGVRDKVNQLNALSMLVPASEVERFRLISLIEQTRGEIALMDLVAGQLRDRMASAEMLLDGSELQQRLSESGTINFCRERSLPLGRLRVPVSAT
jgi:hypothetical protein